MPPINEGFRSHGLPLIHSLESDFPLEKPSSYWGTASYGNPHEGFVARGDILKTSMVSILKWSSMTWMIRVYPNFRKPLYV